MEGRDHVHLIFVKSNEVVLYQKIWPNHVIVGLPPSSSSRGLGMAKHLMKVGIVFFVSKISLSDLGSILLKNNVLLSCFVEESVSFLLKIYVLAIT